MDHIVVYFFIVSSIVAILLALYLFKLRCKIYKELERAERKFRDTFDRAAVGIAHVGLDGKWLLVNSRLCEITGYSEEELLKISFADITYHEDIAKDWEQARALANGEISAYEMEKRYIRKEGSLIWVKLSVSVSLSSEGQPEYYISCVDDISIEHKARRQAELEKEKIIDLFNQVPTPIAIYEGPDHVITLANPEFRNQTKKQDLIGKSYAEAFPLAVEQKTIELLDSVFEKGEPWNAIEYPIKLDTDNGGYEQKYINATLQPFRDLNGNVVGLINLSYDVTEQVKARHNLEESEERFRTLFEQSPLSIEIHSPDGAMQMVNKAWMRLWNISEENAPEVIRTYNVLEDPQLVKKGVYEHIKKGFDGNFAKTPPTLYDPQEIGVAGRVRWVETYINPVKNEDGSIREVVLIHEDITDRKSAEEVIKSAKEAAETANQAKTQFLANMSHEIRTPLGAMLGFAQLMLEDEQATEVQKKSLKTIVRNGEQLYGIINELLDISKVEANKFEIEKIKFDLEEVVRDVTSLLSVKAEQKGIEFNVSSEGPLPDTVTSDPVRFRQILINVIGNAIKFTEKGKVEVTFKLVSSEDENRSSCLEIRVQDTGVGISSEKVAKLFQPFTQADNATNRRFGGTGLGLYLSKKFAHALGGDIKLVHCEVNKGCIFAITIDIGHLQKRPLLSFRNTAGEHSVKGNVSQPSVDRLHDIRVLVVDDSIDNLELTKRFLNAAGAEVEIALGAPKAFESLKRSEFDVIVMDIQMPEIDGYEAVRRLRGEGYEKPIVALTAHAMKGERELCLAAGFDGYLVKPINRPALVDEIKTQADHNNHKL